MKTKIFKNHDSIRIKILDAEKNDLNIVLNRRRCSIKYSARVNDAAVQSLVQSCGQFIRSTKMTFGDAMAQIESCAAKSSDFNNFASLMENLVIDSRLSGAILK